MGIDLARIHSIAHDADTFCSRKVRLLPPFMFMDI